MASTGGQLPLRALIDGGVVDSHGTERLTIRSAVDDSIVTEGEFKLQLCHD
jgi:hypothetical protein